MTRKGKIARLPQALREKINIRLQNGEEGKQVVEWLNTLPEVAALMAAKFNGEPVNENNLSNWKLGGFRDWEAQQEALEAVNRFRVEAGELHKATHGQLADQVALWLIARIAVALREPACDAEDPAGQSEQLRHISAQLVALRKGDHNAERLRIERERLQLASKKYKDEAALKRKSNEPPPGKKRGLSDDVIRQIEEAAKLL